MKRRRLHFKWPLVPVLAVGLITLAGGVPLQAQRVGVTNSLTDVAGLRVGHFQRLDGGYRTGTTVVLADPAATASVDVQGGAPGTRETDLLVPGGLVTQINAIVLSGGSAFGLDAAGGVMQWLEEHHMGFAVDGGVVPIVPAAILFDLGRGGDFSKRPDASFGWAAAERANDGPVEQGRFGAGAGARYGLGSASVVLENGYTVAAIVGLNPVGSPVNPATCLPYGAFLELDGEFGLQAPNASECSGAETDSSGSPDSAPFNTTIAVVATDAPLDQVQVQRMAKVANSGLARAIRPIHNLTDGDAVFGVATGSSDPGVTLLLDDLQVIYNAAADALGRAVVHALIHEGTYCSDYPSACGGIPRR